MKKGGLWSVFVGGLLLLGIAGVCFAGVELSPFQPELNKLHSIELNMAAIQKRLDHLMNSSVLPNGAENYLLAIGNQLGGFDGRLDDVLYLLPPFDGLGTAQEDVSLALDGIGDDAVALQDIISAIAERMGIEPSPWREILESITNRINKYVGCSAVALCN